MLEWYKKFCCGVFYLLKKKAKSDVPFYATFMLTLFLFVLIVFGADSGVYLLFKTKDVINKSVIFGMLFIIAIPNYFFAFKDKRFMEFYDRRLPYLKVIVILLLIFSSSLILILMAGVRSDNG